jgi:hypothetical protein
MYPKWKPAPKADLPMPRVGEPVTLWRANGKADYSNWIMGEKITRFEDLELGEVFIMDSPFFDSMSMIKIHPASFKALCDQGTMVMGMEFDPQDPKRKPINPKAGTNIHANVVYGDDLFARDFYRVSLAPKGAGKTRAPAANH